MTTLSAGRCAQVVLGRSLENLNEVVVSISFREEWDSILPRSIVLSPLVKVVFLLAAENGVVTTDNLLAILNEISRDGGLLRTFDALEEVRPFPTLGTT